MSHSYILSNTYCTRTLLFYLCSKCSPTSNHAAPRAVRRSNQPTRHREAPENRPPDSMTITASKCRLLVPLVRWQSGFTSDWVSQVPRLSSSSSSSNFFSLRKTCRQTFTLHSRQWGHPTTKISSHPLKAGGYIQNGEPLQHSFIKLNSLFQRIWLRNLV